MVDLGAASPFWWFLACDFPSAVLVDLWKALLLAPVAEKQEGQWCAAQPAETFGVLRFVAAKRAW